MHGSRIVYIDLYVYREKMRMKGEGYSHRKRKSVERVGFERGGERKRGETTGVPHSRVDCGTNQ